MNALLIEREGANRQLLTQTLEQMGFANLVVDWPYRGVDYLRAQAFNLCVINVDRRLDLRRFLRILQEQGLGTQVVFLSEKRSREHYNELLAELSVRHLVSKTVPENGEMVVPKELFEHTVRHLMTPTRDFSLDELLSHAKVQRMEITGTPEKNKLYDTVEAFAKSFKLRSRMVNNILHLCDELVMNVIFNAPHDEKGDYIYRGRPRDAVIELKDNEIGTLEYAYDGQFFGLSAIDAFGSLTADMVSHYLTRSYREYRIAKGQEGGGMGFLNMFAFASYFEVFVRKHQITRVTVLINAKEGFKHARSVPRSINFYTVPKIAKR